MEKKLFALSLAAVMLATVMTGCGNNPSPSSSVASASGTASSAQGSYTPPDNMNLVVPYSAGGGTDTGCRIWAKYAEKYAGCTIVIENVSGGGGTVGIQTMLNYPADGSYIAENAPSPSAISTPDNPVTYDLMTDITPVCNQVGDPRIIVAMANNGKFTDGKSFIEYCKAHPGEVTIGCSGTGNTAYYSAEFLSEKADIDIGIISYDGDAEAQSDMMGGHIDCDSTSVGEATDKIASGQYIGLVVLTEDRYDAVPDVETAKELGYDLVMETYRGYVMKAGVSEACLNFWDNVAAQVDADPDYQAAMKAANLPCAYQNRETFTETWAHEVSQYKAALGVS